MRLNDLITRALNDERLTADEVAYLLSLPPTSLETYRLLAASRELSVQVCSGNAEVHAQFAVNLAPCPKNCMFCSFAVATPRDIKEKTEESRGHTVDACRTIFKEADWQTLDGPSAFFR